MWIIIWVTLNRPIFKYTDASWNLGTLCVSAAVIVSTFPYVVFSWQGLTAEAFDVFLHAVLFVIVGILLGFLVEKERAKHRALIDAERLASVGRTVSEIAHDMKTPLMAIGGFTNQVLRSLSPDDPKYRKLEIAVRQTARLEGMAGNCLISEGPLNSIAPNLISMNLCEMLLKCPDPWLIRRRWTSRRSWMRPGLSWCLMGRGWLRSYWTWFQTPFKLPGQVERYACKRRMANAQFSLKWVTTAVE